MTRQLKLKVWNRKLYVIGYFSLCSDLKMKWRVDIGIWKGAEGCPEELLHQVRIHMGLWIPTCPARRAAQASQRTERKLELATAMGHYGSPVIAMTFVVVYWVVGMYHSINPWMINHTFITNVEHSAQRHFFWETLNFYLICTKFSAFEQAVRCSLIGCNVKWILSLYNS